MNCSNYCLKFVMAGISLSLSGAVLHAATIDQVITAGSQEGWNNPVIWDGGVAPTTGNDYRSLGGAGTPGLTWTVNGIDWGAFNVIRDVTDGPTGRLVSSTFGGDNLLLSTNSRYLGKSTGGATQTVNLVMDGGFVGQGASSITGTNASTLAGSISFGTSNIGLLGLETGGSNGTFSWTINSTLIGGVGDTMQVTMGNQNRTHVINYTGNLSLFSGTLYLGVSSNKGVNSSSSFSISSDALNATVQLDITGTNFRYDLGASNVTFGALAYGSGLGTLLDAGIYDAATLNSITGTSAFFGTGTITVVPEPSTTALAVLALLGGTAMARFRRGRRKS